MRMNKNDQKYKPVKIPGQISFFEEKENQLKQFLQNVTPVPSKDEVFAEIEIDEGTNNNQTFSTSQPQVVNPIVDENRKIFNEMRQIARDTQLPSNFNSHFYNKQTRISNSKVFYKQAVFMKDYEDDYNGYVEFSNYFPYYQQMSYAQLRTYFTWRTDVRRGNVTNVSLSYAFVYIYELIHNIGVADSQEGLDKLMFFWRAFKRFDSSIDKYMIKWIKDYHIYYDLPKPFKEFVCENNLQAHYAKVFMYETDMNDNFDLFCNVSKYDIRKSVFLTDDTKGQLSDCFCTVIHKLRDAFDRAGIIFDDLIFYPTNKMSVWTPFQDALFYSATNRPDKKVVFSDKEIYICSQNFWSFSSTLAMNSGRQLIGYIMKQTESELRKVTKFKHKLSADIHLVDSELIKKLESVGLSLNNIIQEAVNQYYKEATKIVVSVDETSLHKIRLEADDTQEKLIVPDIEPMMYFETSKVETVEASPVISQTVFADSSVAIEDNWTSLFHILGEIEVNALKLILQGDTNLKHFADANGVMLEVLADSINEKAIDTIGDNILELDDSLTIYEEYINKIKEMV
jgi:hypothetical protein